jgi:hypothetical protein
VIFFDLFKKYKGEGKYFFWGIGLFREKIERFVAVDEKPLVFS